MKFKEMAERYRKGEATEEEKQQIEEELEKFETLNDLLYDELGLEGERESENAEKDEPGGGEQPLLLVKTDVGTGHAGAGFQLFDGHRNSSLQDQCKGSSRLTVKGNLKDWGATVNRPWDRRKNLIPWAASW